MNEKASRTKKLLKLKTKNGIIPTFISGIYLSSAINILTNETSRTNTFHMIAVMSMFLTSLSFLFLAAKIHELQIWFYSLPEENRTDKEFLDSTSIWEWGKNKKSLKGFLASLPILAWIIGIVSFLIYLWGQDIWSKIFLI